MVNDDDDASSSPASRRPFRRPYCCAIIAPGSSVGRGGRGLSDEPSFATIGRVIGRMVALCDEKKGVFGRTTQKPAAETGIFATATRASW